VLAVAGEHLAAAGNALNESFLGELDPEARRSAEATIDLDAEENACPACAEPIRGHPARCPGCGLRIA
jgi:hypothetical protein